MSLHAQSHKHLVIVIRSVQYVNELSYAGRLELKSIFEWIKCILQFPNLFFVSGKVNFKSK